MKRLCLLMLLATPLWAQEETLFGGKIESGGFGGVVVKFSQIKGEFGVLVGGRGGWIINHSFIIGGGGYGLANENIEVAQTGTSVPRYLTMGYGGLELEYVNNPHKLVHFSLQALIGGGGVNDREKDSDGHDRSFDGDVFFVFEPALQLELNVTTYFRITAGGSYRYVAGVDFKEVANEDLAGPAATLTFKFGKF